jgi:hypothetical protein
MKTFVELPTADMLPAATVVPSRASDTLSLTGERNASIVTFDANKAKYSEMQAMWAGLRPDTVLAEILLPSLPPQTLVEGQKTCRHQAIDAAGIVVTGLNAGIMSSRFRSRERIGIIASTKRCLAVTSATNWLAAFPLRVLLTRLCILHAGMKSDINGFLNYHLGIQETLRL